MSQTLWCADSPGSPRSFGLSRFNRILEIKVVASFGLKRRERTVKIFTCTSSEAKTSQVRSMLSKISCAVVYWSWPSWSYLEKATLCSSSFWTVTGTGLRLFLLVACHQFARFIDKRPLVTIAPPRYNQIMSLVVHTSASKVPRYPAVQDNAIPPFISFDILWMTAF